MRIKFCKANNWLMAGVGLIIIGFIYTKFITSYALEVAITAGALGLISVIISIAYQIKDLKNENSNKS